MSVDIFVFLALENVPDVAKWNRALAERSTHLHITEDADLNKHSGYLPMTLDGQATGCEFYRGPYSELAKSSPRLKAPPFQHTIFYQLSFHSDPNEAAACLLSASVLVASFDGVAFDPQGGAYVSERELVDSAGALRELGEP